MQIKGLAAFIALANSKMEVSMSRYFVVIGVLSLLAGVGNAVGQVAVPSTKVLCRCEVSEVGKSGTKIVSRPRAETLVGRPVTIELSAWPDPKGKPAEIEASIVAVETSTGVAASGSGQLRVDDQKLVYSTSLES